MSGETGACRSTGLEGPQGSLGASSDQTDACCDDGTPRAACSPSVQRLTDNLVYGIKAAKEALPDLAAKDIRQQARNPTADAFNQEESANCRMRQLRMAQQMKRLMDAQVAMLQSLDELLSDDDKDDEDEWTEGPEGTSPEEALINEGGVDAPPVDATTPENLDRAPGA